MGTVDATHYLTMVDRSLKKLKRRVIDALHHDWTTVVTLQVRCEAGKLKSLNNLLDEHKSLPFKQHSPTGPPKNMADQLAELDREATAWQGELADAMLARRHTMRCLKVKVEGRQIYLMNPTVNDDDMADEEITRFAFSSRAGEAAGAHAHAEYAD